MKAITKCRSFESFFIAIFFILCNTGLYAQEKSETVTDVEGNVYQTVKIGTQTWMAENLKVTRFANGEGIPEIKSNEKWPTAYGAFCWYNNDIFFKNTYGALYNFYIIDQQSIPGGKRLTPKGWHVPSVEEWQVLINYLGGEKVAGAKMKEAGTDHWSSTNAETTNESGFNALPGGFRIITFNGCRFDNVGEYGLFWSTNSKNMFTSWCYWLKADKNEIIKFPWNTNNG